MTNSEKIQFLVDRLWAGKWPEHLWSEWTRVDFYNICRSKCLRCGMDSGVADSVRCSLWNPLTRIEDAFMIVEAMTEHWYFTLKSIDFVEGQGYVVTFKSRGSRPMFYCHAGTPQAAIFNAAIAALEAE